MALRLRAAKEPVSSLAGPYGHPFHPVLVTVPIGAWVASFVFDLASRWSDEPVVFAKGPTGSSASAWSAPWAQPSSASSTWSPSLPGPGRSAPACCTWR
ncbi:MAG TPA: DUF2231 domain-containing protein [Actinomycetota bacterium]|nr:DUF2231 domain-containing protein [Actinomycetota bacterium]